MTVENYFIINLHESMGPGGIELATPGSAVRLASVARNVTDCAMRPGVGRFWFNIMTYVCILSEEDFGLI